MEALIVGFGRANMKSGEKVKILKVDKSSINYLVNMVIDYRSFYKRKEAGGMVEKFLKERIEKGESIAFLAFVNDLPVGFVHLYPMFSTINLKKIWVLNDLFVSESCRGHGVGKKLIDQAVDFTKKDGAFRLDIKTEHDNHIAKNLYTKYGFIKDELFVHFNLMV